MNNQVVYKYPVKFGHKCKVTVPQGSTLLNVSIDPLDYESVNFHYLVQRNLIDEYPHRRETFFIVGTGHPVPDDVRFIKTIQDGIYYWHVFREI